MLYVFVEGPDDERYFRKIYGGFFQEKFGGFQPVLYAGWTSKKINGFLNTISHTQGWEYIFFGDADGKGLEQRRADLAGKYISLSGERIFIVQYEIESWYYAGVDETSCGEMKLKRYEYRTDTLTKEDLYKKFPSRADRIAIMQEMLNRYSISLAVQRNYSFQIFQQSLDAMSMVQESGSAS